MTPEEIGQQKEVEFFAAGVAAWYNTALEHDKSVFSLSAGGVGLLITLLTTVGVKTNVLLGLYVSAIFCFLLSLGILLVIFRRNRNHIEAVLTSPRVTEDPLLKRLDIAAMTVFGLGTLFAGILGITSAINSLESEQQKMATNKPRATSAPTIVRKSFTGVERLQNSFNGIGRVSPQSVAAPQAPAPTATPASTPAPASTPTSSKGGSGGS